MSSSFSSQRPRPSVSVPPGVYFRSSTGPVRGSTTSLNSLFASTSLNNLAAGTEDDFRSLIHQAFVPHIGVHASEDTNALAKDKGFASFKDLIRPFGEKVQGRVTVRDSQGVGYTYDDFGIRIRGLSDLAAVPSQESRNTRANGGGTVNSNTKEPGWIAGGNVQHVEDLVHAYVDHAEELAGASLATDTDTPTTGKALYLLYLRRLLSGMPMSPHETFTHPTACIIAISSRNKSPIETLQSLYSSGSNMVLPSYISNEYLRYYVLVHDEDKDDIIKSNALFDQMKRHYGLHCHLLRLRSGRTVMTDDDAVQVPACQWLSAAEELADIGMKDGEEDEAEPTTLWLPESEITGIKTMVREMVAQSIIPFMERCVVTWNDQIASRRKGLSGRFLSMSKRYFGSSRSSGSTSTSNYDAISGSYIPTSPEAQMRKLADYAFMLRDWKLAHSIYDLLRVDFSNDKAWKYHAGAQEMTVISLILLGQPLTTKIRHDTVEPMLDLALYSYLTRCGAMYSALRAVLVAVELLRIRGGGAADDAARWAIRALEMNILGQVGHALVTERVSACYAVRKGVGSGAWGARKRKTAMWKILAARDWIAIGKSLQARYCIEEAMPVYEGTKFQGIAGFINHLKEACNYGEKAFSPLGAEAEILMSPEEMDMNGNIGEPVEFGSKHKRIQSVDGLLDTEERVNDDAEFVDS
ncbi:ER-golgi trafficking TRAPP I complex 85 kDa subunit-domain-containing protein [Kalaharituber pfeilii]|nr:ER-golgi trafficking TRAPP I complex 85 kDa subunit-domain-containing protein [Kalaharituber pfeilii]